MAAVFPQFQHRPAGAGAVRWRGTLQPTQESAHYTVEILHEVWRHPRVWVTRPALVSNPPHVYAGNALCLYYPPDWRWRPGSSLADTIVPWTAFWLYFYELWLVTGEWLGPSSPHDSAEAKEEE